MIVVQELTDDIEFIEIGRVKNGEIIEGRDELLTIDEERVWTEYPPNRLEIRFNGPIVVATEVDDSDDEQTQKQWVPYVGPRGGEGWRNENDPDDVRYTDEPPGELADGYEEYYVGDGSDENDNQAEEDELASVLSSVEYNGDGVYEFDGAGNNTIYEIVSLGDVVTIDASEIGDIAGEEIEATVGFIDSDWVGLEIFRYDWRERKTVPIETITRVDTQANELTGGASAERLNELDTSERLANAFAYAANKQGYRESGGTGGNTTGDDMEVLEYQDGSKDYATPVDAYNDISTGVVRNSAEAVRNNRTAPKIINKLGGSAAQTKIIENSEGREYIVKEGIEGETVSEFSPVSSPVEISDTLRKSATETMASAYFTGNEDLHGGNMIVSDNGDEVTIIDFDSGGYLQLPGVGYEVNSMDTYTTPPGIELDYQEVNESIYEKAIDIREGNIDIGDIEDTDMGQYMIEAADIAARAAYIDEEYDYGDNEVPDELASPPPGIDSIDDLPDPNDDPSESFDVEFVNRYGKVVEAEVIWIFGSEIGLELDFYQTEISDVNRLTEIKQ
jgi:hypothetical protein